MLFITLIVGFFGGISSLIFLLVELFSSYIRWSNVRRYTKITIIFVVMFFVSLFGLGAIGAQSYQETAKTAEYELVSLQDNSQISGYAGGGLFYVYASMDTNEVYMYYYKSGDGYKKGKITSENVIIYEQESCTPSIVEYTTYTKVKMNGILEAILSFNGFRDEEKSYEFYVPKGTVVQTFSLDLQ